MNNLQELINRNVVESYTVTHANYFNCRNIHNMNRCMQLFPETINLGSVLNEHYTNLSDQTMININRSIRSRNKGRYNITDFKYDIKKNNVILSQLY
jgi:hypothetical protein